MALAALLASEPARAADSPDPRAVEDLTQMSLEQLVNVEVTSVLKSPQPLSRAPAAIYVITHDDIIRSGATSLAEVLRLAPNLRVTQLGSSNYTATARGFGGNQADQNFANKLLILIDGRSAYTPLFSGIYFDQLDLVLEDIDRIEVISGPGGTQWGANAVNGVINVITRPSYLTDGSLLSAAAGNNVQSLAARYGGKVSDDLSYRVYGLAFNRDAMELPDGSSARDGWSKAQGGFRTDWTLGRDSLTTQGDVYRATEGQLNYAKQALTGANILGRWQHRTDRTNLQLQAYFDDTERGFSPDGDGLVQHIYDVELQQSVALGSFQSVVWGAGERVTSYAITNGAALLFQPNSRNLTLGDVFVQDTASIGKSLQLTLGVKLEDDPYAGWSALPDARASWYVTDQSMLWASGSRGIRSPTPFDVDVVEKLGGNVFLTGDPGFRPERVSAYELGYRQQLSSIASLSVSVFYNYYDDLRTIEFGAAPSFFPLHWGNSMQGHTYGVEAWADLQIAPWWRVSPGVTTLRKDLSFEPGASGLLGLAEAGDDPSVQASLKSSMNFGRDLTFDAFLRYLGSLPSPALPAYVELTARLGWQVAKGLELSLVGNNLLHARHYEYPPPDGEQVTRGIVAQARWMF